MRSFHATEEDGKEVSCDSLGFTQKEVDEIQSFYCKNCKYCLHQCFACGKLGSSDKVKGAEVIKCASATCDRFYHPHCVAKLLPQVVKHVAEELERNIADGDPFTCPLHYCCVCKELENKIDPELRFAVCWRCPKSYHRKCLPREIAFEDKDDEHIITRAWEELLPNNRILIYCLNHEIDDKLGTPIRDHIKFPSKKATVQEINPNYPTIERKKPGSKERIILKKKNVDLDDSSGESIAKGSKLTAKLSSGEVGRKKQADTKSNESSSCLNENKSSMSKKCEMPDCEENHNQPPTGEKLYALKNEGSDQIKPDNQVNNVINKSLFVKPIRKLSTALPPLDDDSEKSLLALFKESKSSITLESVLKKHTISSTCARSLRNVLEKTITMGKLEGSVDAVRIALRKLESGCSIQDVQAVCDPDVLKQILKWKDKLKIYLAPFLYGNRYGHHFTHVEKLEGLVDKLHWYVQNGDTIVDFSCGANDFSTLMKKKLEETGKKCSYRNYDLLPIKNDASFERRDWMTVQQTELPTGSQLIMGFNSTFGLEAALANKFIDKALEFKPKLLILLVPPETERLDKKRSPYDLIWEDGNFLSDMSFYLPGSADVNDRQIDQRNVRLPLLSLWSLPDWTTKHKVIAQEHGHVSIQHEVLLIESCNTDMLAVDHTPGENYADNCGDHDHLKSADDQEYQTCINGQKRSQHHGNVDQEHQGQKYRMGKSGKTPQKRKHIEENNRTRVGLVSPARRQAIKRILEGVPDHSQPNPINGRSSGEAFQPKSVMACPHVEIREGSNVAGPKSDGLCGIEDPDSNRLSGHDPSCGNTGCSSAQLVSVTQISCKTNTPAMEQDEASLDELNHARISSLGSEPRSFSKSGTLGRSVLQPGYGGGLLGFAPGPNLAYSCQHSAGWLEE
ncbi:protein ENHANCED DOWNY MILDEW 2-like isoform X2 [Abrus precatorius]|uniref:Protein ENHANCED DOWNY MILDEW 2-like isoform X2 n=1 Tax=Abrus precatorius TaxID=3816 RepID=A0A8B8JD32_ABRPR|nr:protein ENHANCED DOWNY MILDEW 2-like isoform X2 [Abrus precatorius]